MFRKIVAALAVSALCFSSPARAGEAEDKAIKLVEHHGGKITRDEKLPGKPIIAIDLSGASITQSELPALAAFSHLATLDLRRAHNIHYGAINELAKFKSLTALGLTLDYAWIDRISQLTNITALDLEVRTEADADMKQLAKLSNIRTLDIAWAKITDAGVKELAGLKTLTKLTLPV